MTIGMRAASAALVSRSSAMPCASFAITFAVAGTIANTSRRARARCAGSLPCAPTSRSRRAAARAPQTSRADEVLRLGSEDHIEIGAPLHDAAGECRPCRRQCRRRRRAAPAVRSSVTLACRSARSAAAGTFKARLSIKRVSPSHALPIAVTTSGPSANRCWRGFERARIDDVEIRFAQRAGDMRAAGPDDAVAIRFAAHHGVRHRLQRAIEPRRRRAFRGQIRIPAREREPSESRTVGTTTISVAARGRAPSAAAPPLAAHPWRRSTRIRRRQSRRVSRTRSPRRGSGRPQRALITRSDRAGIDVRVEARRIHLLDARREEQSTPAASSCRVSSAKARG